MLNYGYVQIALVYLCVAVMAKGDYVVDIGCAVVLVIDDMVTFCIFPRATCLACVVISDFSILLRFCVCV